MTSPDPQGADTPASGGAGAPEDGVARRRRRADLVRRMSGLERLVYTSIGRAVLRRPDVPAGARGFGFSRDAVPLFLVFIALSGLELAVLDLVLRRWLVARVVVDVLDGWGLVWMTGLLCAHLMRPHAVGPDGILVRDGFDLDLRIPWARVLSVTAATRRYAEPPARVIEHDGVPTLVFSRGGETDVEIRFTGPVTVTVPGSPPRGGAHTGRALRLHADDPQAFVQEARRHLAAAR